MRKLWQKIRHNQTLVISGILALAVVFWVYGCQVTVPSILHPAIRLDRIAFQGEVDAFVAQAASRFEQLSQQEELRKKLFAVAIQFAQGGAVNPVAVAVVLGNILGLGAIIDNRRKDVRIKTAKDEIAVLTKVLDGNVTQPMT